VPEIFLYRHPLEVLVGNLRRPTQSWIWLEKHTGLSLDEAWERSIAELFARGIGRTMQMMLDHVSESTYLMNYSEIGPTTPRQLADAFGISVTDLTLRAMAAPLSYSAKDALQAKLFRRDVDEKRAAATSRLRDLVAEFADAPFRDLEARRAAQRTASHAGRARVGSSEQPERATAPVPLPVESTKWTS
jgi:hypothetical protein